MISPGSYLIVSPLLGYVCVTQLRFQIAQGLGDSGVPLLSQGSWAPTVLHADDHASAREKHHQRRSHLDLLPSDPCASQKMYLTAGE